MTSNAQAAMKPAARLQADYPSASAFDEMLGRDGEIAPHWVPFLDAFNTLDPQARAARLERLNQRVRETGIAHDLFADPTASAQPWRIDLVPLVLPAGEWRVLERALIQRARLFEGILSDVYGPQRLMSSGLIPPGLVFNDPSYLRPCHGLQPSARFIQFFAVDVARWPDGRWRVIDTHAETPAGIGYALANRMVHTHVAGDIFSACNALRLAPFFQQVQSSIAERIDRPAPSIALLTPGPRHPDFFSHAYLARYLGFQLVEGEDLRVENERVYLKTLDGLKAIHLIVRCVAGNVADPLELDPSGFLGPVGLVQAARRRPNLIANALGSALAENRGLGGFLPKLSKDVLGEDLMIWDGPRWWLGEAKARRHVIENFDRMVIRPAHERTSRPGRAAPGRDPAKLSAAERASLIQDIEINGARLVAEEKVGFGTTPALGAKGLVPQPYAVRLFVAATGHGYVVMPGGLAMNVDPSSAVALNAPDGATRDVWVASDGPTPPFVSLWRPTIEAAQIQRTPRQLPSRAADNLFWLGRYTERADWTLRVLRNSMSRLEEDSGPRQDLKAVRTSLELLLGKDDDFVPAVSEPTDAKLIGRLARSLMTSTDGDYALPRTLDHIHRIASMTRDRLSLEAWRTLNTFYAARRWRINAVPASIGESLDLIDSGLAVLAGFNGLMHENMTRNFGWSFLDMGRRLSRALNLSEMLFAVFGTASSEDDEIGSLQFVLELADSFITYRSRYRLSPMLPLVLDLLLMDESNPRSLAFQLNAFSQHLDQLPQAAGRGQARVEEQRTVLSLLTSVRLAEVRALAEAGRDGVREELTHLLAQQVSALPDLSDAIARRYFSLTDKGTVWVRTRSRR